MGEAIAGCGADKRQPIRSQFSGGTDFDNDISITGLTFDEAMEVVELLGRIVRARREPRTTSNAEPPSPASSTSRVGEE